MIVKAWEDRSDPKKVVRFAVEEIASNELAQGVIRRLEDNGIRIVAMGLNWGTGHYHVDFRKSPEKMRTTGLLIKEGRKSVKYKWGKETFTVYRFAKKVEPVEIAD